MEDFLSSPAGLGSVAGVLSIIFFPYLQIARGKLVPRSALDDQITEKNTWRDAHGKVLEALTEEQKTGQVTRRFFEGLENR